MPAQCFHAARRLRVLALLLCLPALSALPACLLAPRALAQVPAPRLRQRLAESPRTQLRGSAEPRVRLADSSEAVAPGRRFTGLALVFRRSAAQQADLHALLEAQMDANSPEFHHWLTPGQFAARFGMADADLAAASAWLQSQGFAVDPVPPSRDRIVFSGTSAQIAAAFGTEMRRFDLEGEEHTAPAGDLQLPAALAEVTAAVLHLSDFRPASRLRPLTGPADPAPTPHFTAASSGEHFIVPADMTVMYDGIWALPPSTDPTGVVAVLGQSFIDPLGSMSASVLGRNGFRPVLVPGSGNRAISPGDQAESELDLEYVGTEGSFKVAPLLIYTGDSPQFNVFDALQYAVTTRAAPIISISYGLCETLVPPTKLDALNAVLMQAAAQGQTVVAAAGDAGSTDCAPDPTSARLSVAQQRSLAVDFPASSPYVTAVGGTQMAAGTFAAGNSSLWSASSVDASQPTLLGYVPEEAWNEGAAGQSILAGGGGTSSYFPRPAWQSGVPGMAPGAFRLLPDVSLLSSGSSPGLLLCTDDQSFLYAEGQNSSCLALGLTGSNGRYTIGAGTSFAAPALAGLLLTLEEAIHQRDGIGNINPVLYQLASQPATYSAAFHDVKSGSIACVAGATNCTAVGMSGFAAAAGYDEATGLGSIDLNNLIAAWPASGAAASTRVESVVRLDGPSASVTPGASFPIRVAVWGSGATVGMPRPTGTVTLLLDGAPLADPVDLQAKANSGNGAEFQISATGPSTTGTHILLAVYSGDGTYSPGRSLFTVDSGSAIPSGGLSLTATDVSLNANGTGTSQITATAQDGYHGRVFWDLAFVSGSVGQQICYMIDPLRVPAGAPASGKLWLGSGTACSSGASSRVVHPAPGSAVSRDTSAPLPGNASDPSRRPFAALCAACLLVLLPGRRRRPGRLLALALCVPVLGLGLSGCGGETKPAAPPPASPTSPTGATPGTGRAVLQLTGRDSVNRTVVASTSFTLTLGS